MPAPARLPQRRGSTSRLFGVYAVASLVPVVLLGAALVLLLRGQADARGLARGASQAQLVARTAVAPLLGGHPLSEPLSSSELSALSQGVRLALTSGEVVRLRLRDLAGRVVYAVDGSGLGTVDDEAVAAAGGRTVTSLTVLNTDAGDRGAHGPRVVEAYTPLYAIGTDRRIGVLEVYLPYAPIAADIDRGQLTLTVTLVLGLALLWLVLLAISSSVMRRLRQQAADNAHLARHDPLTGLPNRSEFAARAARAVAAATSQHPVALAVVDLDRFKEVNDTLGHVNGDRLLVTLADRLTGVLGEDDVLARLGGDEFGLLFAAADEAACVELLERVRAALAEPLVLDGLPLAVEASVGFALAPHDSADVDLLLVQADLAMYVAKRQHQGVVRYDRSQDQYDATTLTLVAELDEAIRHDELLLHYQPKADVRSGRIVGAEALVRWQHRTLGRLGPDAFLPAAEQTRLIEPLTRWVLRRALDDLAELDPSGELVLAVNVSARSIIDPGLADDVLAELAATGADPHRLVLEVTETALLVDPARAAVTLTRLHDAGVRISVDDFGAGQTSLGYLATLPVSELKIDKQFVLAMTADRRNASIVRSVVELGHSLGFTVTAEGVETPDHLARLEAAGCDLVQGYLLAPPVDAETLRDLVARQPSFAALPWTRPGAAVVPLS